MRKIILILYFLVMPCFAAQDYYQFDTLADRQRFDVLSSQLRCLVCQNQNLAESNAPLASDLRMQVYQQIQSGKTEKEIISYLVSRYGNFILYRPPLEGSTFTLWFGPFLLLLAGVGSLVYFIRKK